MPRITLAITAMVLSSAALGDATIPTADRRGAQDNPLLKRYEGSLIIAYERKSFAE